MLPTLDAPEIVFGLCSPVGTPNSKIIRLLDEALNKYGYKVNKFKVTSLMKSIVIDDFPLREQPLEIRYDTYISYANEIRNRYGMSQVLAMMCCAAIRAHRRKLSGNAKKYLPNNAYIFDQFKRKEEVDALRQVYGRLFILISIYSSKQSRKVSLSGRIASDHSLSRTSVDHELIAENLIKRDEEEENVENGQRLREAFPLADVFVDGDDLDHAEKTIKRFLAAFFGSNEISPTREEYAMYIAKSAALRSLDLSRQVGAAIFSPEGEVAALGCNEVPKPGGGTYWTGDKGELRDYKIERDENDRIKRSILADVVRRLAGSDVLGGEARSQVDTEALVELVLAEVARKGSTLREAQLMDLLEFGRIIHAEMSAISDAARLGIPIKGKYLFCTTFPCHICAKHIVAAGINRVYFIEPYPKSYAEQLHRDSIILDAGNYSGSKTQFSPFIGISPFRFKELFERGKRKDSSGHYSEFAEGRPKPVVRYTIATYLETEQAVVKIFEKKTTELKRKGKIKVQE